MMHKVTLPIMKDAAESVLNHAQDGAALRVLRKSKTMVSLLSIMLLFSLNGCGGGGSGNGTPSRVSDVPSGQRIAGAPIRNATPYSGTFDDGTLIELSGLQRSRLVDGIYYAHNDAGDQEAILYVTDAEATVLGSVRLAGVRATDWEAIAGVRLAGIPHIVIGDIGNNNRGNNMKLQLVKEPDFNGLAVGFDIEATSREIDLSYSDGMSYDAEALYVGANNDSVYVLTKDGQDTTNQSIWAGSLASGLTNGNLVLEFRGTVSLPDRNVDNAITDIDIHPNGRQIALLTNGAPPQRSGQIYIWDVTDLTAGTAASLTRPADRTLSVPSINSNGQAEAISYSRPGGNYLLIGSESPGRNSRLTVVSL